MKRKFSVTVSFILVCLLVFSIGTAFAAGSMSSVPEVISAVDSDGNEVELTFSEVDPSVWLTEEIAARIIGNVTPEELLVVTQFDVKAAKLPVTITFSVSGADDDDEVYVFHHDGNDWELMNSAMGRTISTTFSSLSPVGLVLRAHSDNGGGDAPKTGESSWQIYTAAAVALVAVCVAVTVVRSKKKA